MDPWMKHECHDCGKWFPLRDMTHVRVLDFEKEPLNVEHYLCCIQCGQERDEQCGFPELVHVLLGSPYDIGEHALTATATLVTPRN